MRRPQNQKTDTTMKLSENRSATEILADIEGRCEAQTHDIALLREQLDVARVREEAAAARLGEVIGELAEARAALERETEIRKVAETRIGTMADVITRAQAMLGQAFVETPPAPTDVTDPEATHEGGDQISLTSDGDPTSGEGLVLSPVELDALDRLAALEGCADRGALIRQLCLRALTDAGLLQSASETPQPAPVVT
jgi:hypothetical protein